jgi:hypothetical protein
MQSNRSNIGWSISSAATLAAASGLALCVAPVALAQDSVSSAGVLPGDAVSAYAAGGTSGTTEQSNSYVVDTALKRSSWGQRFVLAPLVKSSATTSLTATGSAPFFNHLIASTTASASFSARGPLVRTAYSQWTSAGQGINAVRNTAPTSLAVTDLQGQTFGSAFLEFGPGADGTWGTGDDENNIIAALTSVRPRSTSRLYVARVMAAANKLGTAAGNATLGLGSIDNAGFVHFSGDGLNMSLGANPILNKRLFRVNALARSNSIASAISESGGSDAPATSALANSLITLTTPSILPSDIAGRPVLLGLDLAGNYQAEQTAGAVTLSTAHLPAGASARGSIGLTPYTFGPLGATSVSTGAVIARAPATTKTRALSAWGIAPNGAPTANLLVQMPTTTGVLIDRDDSFDPALAFGSPENQEFTNYQSQAVFRGANGPAAVTVLASGDMLLAATVAATGGGAAVPQSMNGYIAVARVPAGNTGNVTWTIAAHTGNSAGAAGGLSKKIYGDNGADGLPGTGDEGENDGTVDGAPIGELALNSEVFPGATGGPSISAPAFDSAGNVYFMSAIELFQVNQPRRTVGLLRANLDPATNAYKLELLAQIGDVLPGVNSQRNYQIQFLSVADSDSIDSGSIWSSSSVQTPLAHISRASLPYASPLSLGALVFRAKLTYDVNNDGSYVDPTGPGGVAGDESYNVLLALLPQRAAADIAGAGQVPVPDGQFTADDIIVFINGFFAGNADVADFGGTGQTDGADGQLTADDIILFINAFFSQL